jgi:hypothetical protein
MATTPQRSDLTLADSLTVLDRFLVDRTYEALADGIALQRWCRDPGRRIAEFPLDLKRPYKLPNKAFGYFSDLEIAGHTRTVIGVRQEVEFGRATGPNPEERLKRYVLRDFLPTSHWTYPDGWPGGFTYEQLLYCTPDGRVNRYEGDQRSTVQDWTAIGPTCAWSLFTVFLHDFVLRLGPITKHMQEAATLVQHPDFIHVVERPAPGYTLEVAIGYPFINYAPIPNNFGFGPGKFDWAVKLFSFMLRDNGEVRCNMDFAAGARPAKVFDFGKHVPCPIYGGAAALHAISLGLFDAQRFHDRMDGAMVAQHARVHQALMEGSAPVFAELVRTP